MIDTHTVEEQRQGYTTQKTRETLTQWLVNVIAQAVAPEQVILFGSQARGTARPDSDYDFLVVMRNVENERHVSRRIYRALFEQQVGVAVDVVVVNAEKLARHCETPGFVYKQALQEGEVCYDRTSSI